MKLLYSTFIVATVALCLAAVSNSHPLQQVEPRPLVTVEEKSLGPLSREDLNRKSENQPAAFVVSGSIVMFTSNVGIQGREDVVNATLFAQLAANYYFNKQKEPQKWYSNYTSVLESIGFVLTSSDSFQQVKTPKFRMEDVVVKTLQAPPLAKSVMDALGKLPANNRAVQLFDSNSTARSSSGNFQVIICDQSASGEIDVLFGMFYFHGPKYDPRFLWSTVSSKSVAMFVGTNQFVLNEDVYAGVRDDIAKRLGNTLHTMVATIGV